MSITERIIKQAIKDIDIEKLLADIIRSEVNKFLTKYNTDLDLLYKRFDELEGRVIEIHQLIRGEVENDGDSETKKPTR